MKKTPIAILKERLADISHLSSLLALAFWDQEVNLPSKAADSRATAVGYLSGIVHEKFVDIDADGLLSKLKKEVEAKKIKGKDVVVIMETWKSYERERKLPKEFVKEITEVTSKAQGVWAEARKNNDFKLFLPWLTKIVNLKRKEAEYIGYKDSPYDALIDLCEPGMTSAESFQILNDLKDFLLPFIKKINASKLKIDSKKILGNFPIEKQEKFNEMVVKKIGFDFEAGRIDKAAHPFASGFHPHDVRMTTRYSEKDIFYSLGSTIHETGHGLYEQGLPVEHFGTPLSESVSLGIHESQSRLWENLIGNSQEFWKYFYPKLQKEFPVPYKSLSFKEFYEILNKVTPSLIRTESDEVTYNLHIIIRFEIEKEMIEGTIELKDLPEIWKGKMKDYLGVTVPTDALGVLQDVHWSCGLIGYFPTYSFGNLYSAQFFATMKKNIPNMEKQISSGNFEEIREWLKKNIHSKGKTYRAGQLVKKVTGEPLTSKYFIEYLENKYKKIYKDVL